MIARSTILDLSKTLSETDIKLLISDLQEIVNPADKPYDQNSLIDKICDPSNRERNISLVTGAGRDIAAAYLDTRSQDLP